MNEARKSDTKTTIKVTHSTAYGVDRFKPVNETGQRMAKILGVQAFSKAKVKELLNMNFNIEIVAPDLEELLTDD